MFSRDYGDLSVLLIYKYFQLIFLHSGNLRGTSNIVDSAATLRKWYQNKLNVPRCMYTVLSSPELTFRA